MSIWTSKVILGGIAALCVTACKPLPEDASGPPAVAVKTAKLSQGVSVAAPDGFCLDAESLSSTFALFARCDTLGVRARNEDAPLAVITVTTPREVGDALPSPEALVSEGEALLRTYTETNLQLVQVAGTAPAQGLSGRHWRGAGLVGRNLIGVAIYPAANGPGLDEEGARLLRETYILSLKQSKPTVVATKPKTTRTGPKKGLQDLIAGLFQ